MCECLIDRHAAAPAVVDHERVSGVLERSRVVDHLEHPAPQDVAGTIGSALERANEYRRGSKRAAGRQARLVGTRQGVKAGLAAKRRSLTPERDARAPAELDADIPAALRAAGIGHQQ